MRSVQLAFGQTGCQGTIFAPRKSACGKVFLVPGHTDRSVGWGHRITHRENPRPPKGTQINRDGPADNSDRIDFKQDERFLATTPYHY